MGRLLDVTLATTLVAHAHALQLRHVATSRTRAYAGASSSTLATSLRRRQGATRACAGASSSTEPPPPPSSWTGFRGALFTLNASTKWLVTIAHTTAVWYPPKAFYPPFIVVGSILATFLTEALKTLINQSRPADAPFADPGMPSSHALVSFFAAAAWIDLVGGARPAVCASLAAAASIVAGLRVFCRYHTKRQVLVGALVGTALGRGWMVLGARLASRPSLAFALAWASYLGGSALFIGRNMRTWVAKDRAL